jgi:hypothetical protein
VKVWLCCCRTVNANGSFEETPVVGVPFNQVFYRKDTISAVNCIGALYIFIHLKMETEDRIHTVRLAPVK